MSRKHFFTLTRQQTLRTGSRDKFTDQRKWSIMIGWRRRQDILSSKRKIKQSFWTVNKYKKKPQNKDKCNHSLCASHHYMETPENRNCAFPDVQKYRLKFAKNFHGNVATVSRKISRGQQRQLILHRRRRRTRRTRRRREASGGEALYNSYSFIHPERKNVDS